MTSIFGIVAFLSTIYVIRKGDSIFDRNENREQASIGQTDINLPPPCRFSHGIASVPRLFCLPYLFPSVESMAWLPIFGSSPVEIFPSPCVQIRPIRSNLADLEIMLWTNLAIHNA